MKAAYQKVLDDTYSKYKNQGGKYLEYHVYDADQDGTEELIVRNGTCEADYMWKIYTYDGGRAVLLDTFAGGHTSLYVCSSGGFTACRHIWEMKQCINIHFPMEICPARKPMRPILEKMRANTKNRETVKCLRHI